LESLTVLVCLFSKDWIVSVKLLNASLTSGVLYITDQSMLPINVTEVIIWANVGVEKLRG